MNEPNIPFLLYIPVSEIQDGDIINLRSVFDYWKDFCKKEIVPDISVAVRIAYRFHEASYALEFPNNPELTGYSLIDRHVCVMRLNSKTTTPQP
jgi:hypothetical protein